MFACGFQVFESRVFSDGVCCDKAVPRAVLPVTGADVFQSDSFQTHKDRMGTRGRAAAACGGGVVFVLTLLVPT